MAKGITSVEGLIRKVFKLDRPEGTVLYYRGHSRRDEYELAPSLFRNTALTGSEDQMFRELLISNPDDFADDRTTLDKLVRMQHHSLPTRLLDITSNPLIALYFACKSGEDVTGEVVVFGVRRSSIKYFDSDTASCIANLARLANADKEALEFDLEVDAFNQTQAVRRLLQFIREEKPYFLDRVLPSDLQRIIVVRTKLSNTRILSQSGAFLLFGQGATIDGGSDEDVQVEGISVNSSEKAKILRELDELHINESTVFPYIESSAKYIARKYGG
ncbi:MAG: FRG domain-containing protein [Armatimonadetes bacterium]|nr:FRG domain-containing protein [Armatimonadota bacterium]